MNKQEIIWDNYKIEADPLSRTLYSKRVVKSGKNKGKVEWDVEGHFNLYRMDALLQKMLHLESLKHGHTFSLEEYIGLWARLYEKMKEDLDKKFKFN